VAVRLVVEREKEIKAFTPEEYWSLNALLSQKIDDAEDFKAEVLRYRDKKLQVHNADQAGKAQKELESSPFRVIEREDKPTRSRPYPPFVTSTLQQAASVRLGFGVARTMRLAQRLYENGYITYMRTDSTRLSDEAVFGIRSFIQQNFGLDYLPESKRVYSSKALAQEAHEAIRPSDISVTADSLKADNDAKKLYDLIWRQTMASQMKDAEFDTSSVRIEAGDYELRARGRVMRFDGWQKVLPQKVREGELADLPPLKAGEDLRLNKVMSQQHFTKPPPRYSEASLVKELEKRGIGRPSTYAQIISTIQDRGYVQQQRRRFHAEKIGEIVTFQLMKSFPDLMDYRFTAQLEERLDRIASEEMEWQEVLDLFYRDFQKKTAAVEKEKMLKIEPPEVDIPCAECGRPMLLYVGKNGTFLGCSGYRLAKDKKCRFTRNLVRIETPSRPQQNGDEDEGNVDELLQKKRCPRCGMAMDIWQVDDTMRLHLCGNSPLCGGALLEKGDFSSPGGEKEGEAIHCDKCGKIMVRKEGRFGPYYACSEAPKCKNTRKILKSGKVAPPRAEPVKLEDVPCPKCSASMVLREGARGLFLACSKFPWCKGSGNVPVDVLRRYRDRLEKKFQGLIDGPEKCPQCEQRVMLHWSVKGKRYYYSCENRKCKWIQNLEPAAKTEEKS
jgi:DNA topoisomerase-1